MIVSVDPALPVPPYEQIRAQVETMIALGTLPPGTRLPSIRQLAGDLGVAANTVARSYRELETSGLVVTRVGTARR
jgi:DNA-binding transcriptional regulator YhcF (GntR family)